jgi:hypothetical protein
MTGDAPPCGTLLMLGDEVATSGGRAGNRVRQPMELLFTSELVISATQLNNAQIVDFSEKLGLVEISSPANSGEWAEMTQFTVTFSSKDPMRGAGEILPHFYFRENWKAKQSLDLATSFQEQGGNRLPAVFARS